MVFDENMSFLGELGAEVADDEIIDFDADCDHIDHDELHAVDVGGVANRRRVAVLGRLRKLPGDRTHVQIQRKVVQTAL